MTLYLISATPGTEPLLLESQSQGFIEATTKTKAIAQASRSLSFSHHRLEALTKSEMGEKAWDIEQELFPLLPRFCESPGCKTQLGKTNKTGFCQKHTEHAPHRKKRKPAKSR